MESNNYNTAVEDPNESMDSKERTNLIINYLPQTLQDDEFFKMFCEIGPIKSSRIVRDNKTGYSYGFGFIEYQAADSAVKAIAQLNNLPVAHKRIKVSYARPPGEDIKGTNLYIQNIPKHYTEDQLEELFSKYGEIVQKNILQNKANGQSKGVGFVRYDKRPEAQNAIHQMNGFIPQGESQGLGVRLAEEHGKQKAAYYAGYVAGKIKDGMGYQMPPMPPMPPMNSFGKGRGGYNTGFNDPSSFAPAPPYGRGGGGGGGGGYNNMPGKLPPFRPNKRFNPMRNDNLAGEGGFMEYNNPGQYHSNQYKSSYTNF